jgi:site-specific DNA-methyltransferase (adenine-specific)
MFYANQLYPAIRAATDAADLAVQEYPLIWYKGHGMAPGRGYMYTPCTELILYGWKPPRKRMLERTMPALLEQKSVSVGRRLHAFQKPVALLETLIRQSTIQGEIVLDPFGGVASTVVAALRTHRVGIGFELSPQHHLLGGKRIADELAKGVVTSVESE